MHQPICNAKDAVFLDHLALRDLLASPVDLESLERLELQGHPESHPKPLANLRPHLHANPARLAHPDHPDPLAALVNPERAEHPEDLEMMHFLELQDPEDLLDHRARPVSLDLKVMLVLLLFLSH